jgi:TolB protein
LLAVATLAVAGLAVVAISANLPGDGVDQRDPTLVVVTADGGLATMSADGTVLGEFEVDGVAFQFPAWSPDGTRIAAIGREGRDSGVYVLAADAPREAATVVYASEQRPPFYLYWAPDGRNVSFLNTEAGTIALRIAPADGSTPARTVREASPFYWDWIGSDRLLLHTGANGPDAFVGEVDRNGEVVAADGMGSGIFRAPAIGADDRFRAWVGPTDDGNQAVVVEARAGGIRHEVDAPGNVAIGFDPAGTTLAFIASGRPDDVPPIPVGSLQAVDAATGDVRTLLDGAVVAFFWSPDGRLLATLEIPDESGPGIDEALVGRRIASISDALPPFAAGDRGARMTLRILDAATGEGLAQRTVQVSDLFAVQVLPFFDQYARSHRIWASDSSGIVLPIAAESGLDEVVVFAADERGPRSLGAGSMAFWSP